MSGKKNKFMDALQSLESSSESEEDEPGSEPESSKKKVKTEVTLDQLEKCGYKGGPSVLYVKPPKEDTSYDFAWSDGKAAKANEDEQETLEERERTRRAVTEDVDGSASFAQKAVAQAAKLAQAKREEKMSRQQDKQFTFSQKEKRKRDSGQASRGKNFVEEEKRMGRNFGVYSGFD